MSKNEARGILLQKRFLTTVELSEEYGFGESNQAKMRMKNKIPFNKIGRYIRYDRVEIDKWIVDNRVGVVA